MGLIILDKLIWNILTPFFTDDPQVFWSAIGAVGGIVVAWTALAPLIKSSKLGLALFSQAAQIEVSPDGVMSITNIAQIPITINSVKQELIAGSHLAIDNNDNRETLLRIKTSLRDLPLAVTKNIIHVELDKDVAPGLSFTFGNTLTHLPDGMKKESVWIVRTRINYTSPEGTEGETKFTHRFSWVLEPRDRWVEVSPDKRFI